MGHSTGPVLGASHMAGCWVLTLLPMFMIEHSENHNYGMVLICPKDLSN